jgi:hypothetical protein
MPAPDTLGRGRGKGKGGEERSVASQQQRMHWPSKKTRKGTVSQELGKVEGKKYKYSISQTSMAASSQISTSGKISL